MSKRDELACCEHGLIWHHETRGCGYYGFAEEGRCPCVLTFDQALAQHDAELRESIAQAIEGGCAHPIGPIHKMASLTYCVRCGRAARIAREGAR